MLTRLDHVAIAVADLPEAVRLFHGLLGLGFVGGGDNRELGIRVVQLRDSRGCKIELLTPLRDDTFLARFLDARGQGFHHITGYVEDVGAAVDRLAAAGYPTVDTTTERDTWHETFTRPGRSFGTIVQLARPQVPWSQPLDGVTADDVLAGRVTIHSNTARWADSGEAIHPVGADV